MSQLTFQALRLLYQDAPKDHALVIFISPHYYQVDQIEKPKIHLRLLKGLKITNETFTLESLQTAHFWYLSQDQIHSHAPLQSH